MIVPATLAELLDVLRAKGVHAFHIQRPDLGSISVTLGATAPVAPGKPATNEPDEDRAPDPIDLIRNPPRLDESEEP